MNIKFYYDNTDYRLKNRKKTVKIIEEVIRSEGRIPGDLNFIFTDDEGVRSINREFLSHDYFTDVIAFGYSETEIVTGEIYMSVDTIRRNSMNYKVSLWSEVLRIIVHGTLHICGCRDETTEGKSSMRRKEDKWIERFKSD